MTIGSHLIATCCCETGKPSESCIASDVIGSCYGLVSDPDCGIKPTIGEYQVLTQVAAGFNNSTTCQPPFQSPCKQTYVGESEAPRQLTYRLIGSVDGLPPCYWIWFTKARSIAHDLHFPSTNRCCCQGSYYLYGCENLNAVPCTTPTTCGCDVYNSTHGGTTDEICVGNGIGCASVGTYDYERDAGFSLIPAGAGNHGGNWFTTKYPSATSAEEGADDWGGGSYVTTYYAGLSAYQLRVAELAHQWTWEINRFNDGKPIKVNGTSFPYQRPDGSVGTAFKYRGTDGSVTDQDATGGHPLFRYFHAFCHAEYAYLKRTEPTSSSLWQKTTPYKFLYAADGVPIFSFELDATERALFYQPQQYSFAAAPDDTFKTAADDIDAMLKGGPWIERMSAKDWRGEVMADLLIVNAWGALNDYAGAADVLALFPTTADLKLMFPTRLRGDLWNLRAINATTGNPTGARPPSLARVSPNNVDGFTAPYLDSIDFAYTGQVDKAIYNMPDPVGGTGVMTTEARNAFFRLTRSVYFRAQPAGWDWSAAPMEGDPNRKPRYSWLLNRQLGKVSDGEALSWSVLATTGEAAITHDNVWCTSGLPQVVIETTNCPEGINCLGSTCDVYFGHAGYSGNVNVLVGRGEQAHGDRPDEEGNCCEPNTLTAHAETIELGVPTHETSNLCFFRHAHRTYWWDTDVAPFELKLTASLVPPAHPIDDGITCGPFPAISTQNDSGGGPVSFCGNLSCTGCFGVCAGAYSCNEYSYAVVVEEGDTEQPCEANLTTQEQVALRPAGSIIGQRRSAFIGYAECSQLIPVDVQSCICPENCSNFYPVVVPTVDPE